MANRSGWFGFDFDGTLVVHESGQGLYPIGRPVPSMVSRVRGLLDLGWEVRIFTARVTDPDPKVRAAIQAWCLEHIGVILDVTNVKDFSCIAIFDDRAIAVERNTGMVKGFMDLSFIHG